MRLLVTRPLPAGATLAARLVARGHEVLLDPLTAIEPLPRQDAPRAAAIVLTSANAVPALTPAELALPIFAVGAASAKALRARGASSVRSGPGDARALAALILADPPAGPILLLQGEDHRPEPEASLAAAGCRVLKRIVYRARAASALAPATIAALEDARLDAVLLYSARTARIFVELVALAGLAPFLSTVCSLAFSAEIDRELEGPPWRKRLIAARCHEAAMLDLLDSPVPR